ncbi:hypothetical protein MASR2M48_25590 [Spirochaetota bacterium]
MLALPGIPALPGGIESPRQTTSSHKASTVGESPFLKMLSLLGSGKSAAEAGMTSAGQPVGAASLLSNKPGGKLGKQKSNKESEASSQAIKQGLARLVSTPLGNKTKSSATQAVPADDGSTALKTQKLHKDAKGQDDPMTAAQTAMALKAQGPLSPAKTAAGLEGKLVSGIGPRAVARDGKNGPGSNAGNEASIETIGTHTERAEGGKRVSVVDMRLKARSEQALRQSSGRNAARSSDQTAAGESVKHELSATRNDTDGSAFGARLASSLEAPVENSSAPLKDGAQAQPQSLTENLATRLRDGAADIVRSAQIVLKDGDSGIIRLRLEPESLGGVKIELKMTEKQISGKIVVQSDIAGEAFRSSLDALKDAFAECGFETTALEVEVRNGLASGAEGNAEDRSGGDGPYWSRSLKELDAAVPMVATAGRDGLVNVVV